MLESICQVCKYYLTFFCFVLSVTWQIMEIVYETVFGYIW